MRGRLRPGPDSFASMTSPSRGAWRPRVCMTLSLLRTEGAGNAGCTLHPRSRVQDVHKNAHTSIQVQSEHSGIPCAMALRLMPRSPRRRIRLASVAAGLMAGRSGRTDFATDSLTPATGARTTRFCRTHQRRSSRALCSLTGSPPCEHACAPDAAASTTTCPNVRDDGQRPSSRDRCASLSDDLPDGLSGKFFPKGLDTKFKVICPSGKRTPRRRSRREVSRDRWPVR
jgi:hypothetical protein